MSLILRDTAGGKTGPRHEGSETAGQRNTSTGLQFPITNTKTFSLTRRVIMAVVACEVLLAIGLALAAALYAKTHVAMYAGLAGHCFLLAANLYAIWAIRRALDPLRELALRAGEISAQNWNLGPARGQGLAEELSPLVEAIDAALARIKATFRKQQEFTSDAAHELKTSVAIIKSALQLMLQRPRTQREYEIGLEELLDDCSRLEDLLGRMLRLARIEQLVQDGGRPKAAATDLTSSCEAAVSRMQALAEKQNVTLEFSPSNSILLPADPEDLELIWMNLLENAVQNSPPGSTVKMSVSLNGKGQAQISVLDSGPGIPPEVLPHIFERFYRGDRPPGRSTSGFGLGLAICKALVEAYGGTIEATNLPERGAELLVELPIPQK